MRIPRPGKDISWKEFLRALYCDWERERLGDSAGMLAFSAVLAVFPFLLFAVALASLFIDPTAEAALIETIRRVVPAEAANILADRIHSLTSGTSPALVTLSGVGAIWAASSGVTALMGALNAAYGVEETRPFWKTRAIAVLVTIGAAVLALVASLLALVAPALARWVDEPLKTLILALRLPVAAVFMTLVLALLYYVLPNVKQTFHLITPGSVAAVVLWLLGSAAFSFYASHFGRYEVAYGALGGVIVLLLWMWLSASAVLIGAAINGVLRTLQALRDRHTRGDPCPPPISAPAAPLPSIDPAAPRSTGESARHPTPSP